MDFCGDFLLLVAAALDFVVVGLILTSSSESESDPSLLELEELEEGAGFLTDFAGGDFVLVDLAFLAFSASAASFFLRISFNLAKSSNENSFKAPLVLNLGDCGLRDDLKNNSYTYNIIGFLVTSKKY